jgi:hypothetical protein
MGANPDPVVKAISGRSVLDKVRSRPLDEVQVEPRTRRGAGKESCL